MGVCSNASIVCLLSWAHKNIFQLKLITPRHHSIADVVERISLSKLKGVQLAPKQHKKRVVFELLTSDCQYLLASDSEPVVKKWIELLSSEKHAAAPQPPPAQGLNGSDSVREGSGEDVLLPGEKILHRSQSTEDVLYTYHAHVEVSWWATLKMTNYRLIFKKPKVQVESTISWFSFFFVLLRSFRYRQSLFLSGYCWM